ncbi:hypothetical protein HU675_0038675 [Bradyrhizobium septentrionale]|uniref:DUF6941 family protein n=1 Tax=Bradyrhizobium septentrionale TaxID=1404411 RepID=UPI0015970EB2|nr:hypothetical protein [Bradyrhizobium septentrionale]UGY23812.1 hypothetical protein HU675_0038675 [Bradyrhizobium septentrionale]
MSDLKVKFAFVCDDARREDNGKLIFIGVYAGSILVQSLPANLVLCLVMSIQTDRQIETPIVFQIHFDGESATEGATVITLQKGDNFSIFPGIPVAATQPCRLSIRVKFGEEEWQEVVSAEVLTLPSATTASQPPAEQSRRDARDS